ncbi:preprotein translocase subunit SecF [Pseudomonas sp. TE3786]
MPITKPRPGDALYDASAGADSGSRRRVFNFVGGGKSAVLVALAIIVGGIWHSPAHGLSLGGSWDVYAAFGTLLSVTLYSCLRFSGTIALATLLPVALDLSIVLALLALFNFSLDPGCTAALVAVIGYSLLGKATMLKRIADNLRNAQTDQPLSLSLLANVSIQQTLGQARIGLLAVMLILSSLYLFAGNTLHLPALVLMVGGLAATASSVFVASAIWLTQQQRRATTVVPTRYRAALDGHAFLVILLALVVLGVGVWFWLPA